jgi:glutaredoxin
MDFVKMYSAEWCHDCKAILSFFEEKNIDYKVINVDTDPQAIEKLKQLCGGKKIVPTLEINGKVYINPTIDTLTSMI